MHRMLESLKIASPVRKRNCSTRSHSAGTTLDCYGSKPGPAPGADTKCARIGGQETYPDNLYNRERKHRRFGDADDDRKANSTAFGTTL